MKRIFVKMFGEQEIIVEGARLNTTLRRTEALLYYLAVNNRVERDEVIGLLWEGQDIKKCRKNLRNLLYKLKQDLGFDLLISINRETLIVNPDVDFASDYKNYLEEGKPYSGNILNGFELKKSPKFNEWKEKIELELAETREKIRLSEKESEKEEVI